jgi:ATP-dependent exoDNAse (exonuclease V) alpha subunit
MTINKSQGQTFNKVGILLDRPVFAYGQLYVALSRARSISSLIFQFTENKKVSLLHVRSNHTHASRTD